MFKFVGTLAAIEKHLKMSYGSSKCTFNSRYEQANSENCGPPLGNKFDLEVGQRSRSRSRHGIIGKVLLQRTHMPSIKALPVIVQKLWPRLKFL